MFVRSYSPPSLMRQHKQNPCRAPARRTRHPTARRSKHLHEHTCVLGHTCLHSADANGHILSLFRVPESGNCIKSDTPCDYLYFTGIELAQSLLLAREEQFSCRSRLARSLLRGPPVPVCARACVRPCVPVRVPVRMRTTHPPTPQITPRPLLWTLSIKLHFGGLDTGVGNVI